MVRVLQCKILVIVLRPVESLQWGDLRNDTSREHLGGVELCDVCRGNALLFVIHVKDRGAVRSADVGSLSVKLRRIVSHGKKDAKQLAIRDSGRIVDHFDRFRVAGGLGDHLLVSCGLGRTAGVARRSAEHTFDALKDGLSSPKAAARKHRRLHSCGAGERCVQLGRRNRRIRRVSRNGHDKDCKAEGQKWDKQAGGHKGLLEWNLYSILHYTAGPITLASLLFRGCPLPEDMRDVLV